MYLRGDFIILIPMNKQQILEFIRSRRKSLKINQDEMANKLDIAQAQYSRYEADRSEVSLEKLIQIMELLDLEINVSVKNNDETVNTKTIEELQKHLLECIYLMKHLK